ncbi:hypothetical protein T06_14590 [Trichinella sp. T6]|nr:hypothetical protein T06_14590 [Trichinella sp. T6]
MLSHADTFSLSRRYHRRTLQTEDVTKVPTDQSLPGTSDKQRAYRHEVLTDSDNRAWAVWKITPDNLELSIPTPPGPVPQFPVRLLPRTAWHVAAYHILALDMVSSRNM